MGKYTKSAGCKVEQWVYDKIYSKYDFPSDYLRNLIYNDLNKDENDLKSVVNHVVNDNKHDDESLSIDDKVYLIFKRKNDE